MRRKKIFKTLFILVGIVLLGIAGLASILYFQIHRTNGEITSSGEKRTYLLYVPPAYRADQPTPLVISIHGYAEWPAHQMEISHWNQMAAENNFIVVYPSGTGSPMHWRTGGADSLPDIQFISDLIDHLEKDYNIDPARIYANGLSNGGGMSFVLACKLSNRIAAIGSVSGAYLFPWKDCNPERPLPAMIFHGTQDPIVPFSGGPSSFFKYPFPVVNDWVKALAAKNGCSEKPLVLSSQGEVSGIQYTHCVQNAEVLFYTIANGGHSWPGGGSMPEVIVGHTTQDIDATQMLLQFFQRHPMKK